MKSKNTQKSEFPPADKTLSIISSLIYIRLLNYQFYISGFKFNNVYGF